MFFHECEMIKNLFFFRRLCEGIFSGREYSVRKVKAYKKNYTMKSYIDKKSAKVFTRKRTFCVYNSLKSSTFYALNFLKGLVPQHHVMLHRLCKFACSSKSSVNVQSDDLACACIYGYARGSGKKKQSIGFFS